MKHLAVKWCLVLQCMACLLLPAPGHASDELAHQYLGDSVFRLEARDSMGRNRYGSGVLVAAETLVTNCHVVLNARDIQVVSASGRLHGQLIRAHIERDVCLIMVPKLAGKVVLLGNTKTMHEGDPIVAVGFAKGAALTVTRGHVEGLFTYKKGSGRVVQGSATFSPGKSGGGLFDTSGKLIGILTFKCLAGGPFHFAVPVEWAKTLMHEDTDLAATVSEKPFWKRQGDELPTFLRAASLLAAGDCGGLNRLASTWYKREPNNPDAIFVARSVRRCLARVAQVR